VILAVLLAAATPSAADAERAFASAAQAGQWTAFRRFAADDAVMFVPKAINAQAWLKDRKDPPYAVLWWAADSYVACDGNAAVNTGPWMRPWAKAVGYFSTVWLRQPDGGWKWTMDSGDALATPRPAGDGPKVRRASCKGSPSTVAAVRYRDGDTGEGQSEDRTLAWRWHVAPDGVRSFDAWLWDGRQMRSVVADRIAAS
jgi:ketosteroid isomerase-like protein